MYGVVFNYIYTTGQIYEGIISRRPRGPRVYSRGCRRARTARGPGRLIGCTPHHRHSTLGPGGGCLVIIFPTRPSARRGRGMMMRTHAHESDNMYNGGAARDGLRPWPRGRAMVRCRPYVRVADRTHLYDGSIRDYRAGAYLRGGDNRGICPQGLFFLYAARE